MGKGGVIHLRNCNRNLASVFALCMTLFLFTGLLGAKLLSFVILVCLCDAYHVYGPEKGG